MLSYYCCCIINNNILPNVSTDFRFGKPVMVDVEEYGVWCHVIS